MLAMSKFPEYQDGKTEDDGIQKLLEFSEDYQSQDFPNPNGEGCPSESTLKKEARSGRLLDESLREHILTCSPCFNTFKKFRNTSIAPPISKTMVAGIGAFLVLIIAGCTLFFLYTGSSSPDDEIVKLESQSESGIVEPTERKSDPPAAGSPSQKSDLSRSESIPPTFRFSVESNGVDRGRLGQTPRRKLPSGRINFEVKLPDGSPTGLYRVTILDEFGRSLAPEIITSSDGSRFVTQLNLAQLQGPARLCVSAGDEVPDCFAVLIK